MIEKALIVEMEEWVKLGHKILNEFVSVKSGIQNVQEQFTFFSSKLKDLQSEIKALEARKLEIPKELDHLRASRQGEVDALIRIEREKLASISQKERELEEKIEQAERKLLMAENKLKEAVEVVGRRKVAA